MILYLPRTALFLAEKRGGTRFFRPRTMSGGRGENTNGLVFSHLRDPDVAVLISPQVHRLTVLQPSFDGRVN
jgi:hypothetical protein